MHTYSQLQFSISELSEQAEIVSHSIVGVVEGTMVVLNCTTKTINYIEWTYLPLGALEPISLYSGDKILQNFQTSYRISGDKENGEYNLQIDNVLLSYAGTYSCIDGFRSEIILSQSVLTVRRKFCVMLIHLIN